MNDLKFAFRQLLKNPGFAAVAVATLALGIGANTAIFSLFNAVLLKPLSYPEPERLVWLSERSPDFPGLSLSYRTFEDWQKDQNVFQHFGVYKSGSVNLTEKVAPLRLQTSYITSGALNALGQTPVLGRGFTAEDDKVGAARAVMLSHALWQSRFGGSANILNQSILLDNEPHTVVGVMPTGFAFPSTVDLWMSMGALVGTTRLHLQERGYHAGFFGVARLKPAVSLEQARAGMENLASQLRRQFPESGNAGTRVDPLLENYVSNFRRVLWTLLGAVGMVLLIACTNVANLLLARSAVRQKEMALRAALGASRWRVLRQAISEGLLLAGFGALAGIILAKLAMPLIVALARQYLPRTGDAGIDGGVLLFTAGLAVLTGLLFGLVPAWQAGQPQLQKMLNSASRGITAGQGKLRQGLVVAEVAVTLVLLVAAGLLLRSFETLQKANPGFIQDRVLTFRFDLPEEKYTTEEQRSVFYQALMEKLRLLPGVQNVSVTSRIPLDPTDVMESPFTVEGEPVPKNGEFPTVELAAVSPDYFHTMGIPVLHGRAFTDLDDRSHLKSRNTQFADAGERWMAGISKIIIDEQFANKYWPNRNPIGSRIRLPWRPDGPVLEVVGVVGRVKLDKLSEPSRFVQGYLSYLEAPRRGMAVVVRTGMAPETLVAAVHRQVLSLDPEQPVYAVQTLAQVRDASIASQRLTLLLIGVFAAVALILAVIGLYGVLAYFVTQRHREIGVRVALGARRADVLKLILRHGMTLTVLGVVIGTGLSFALTQLLSTALYEIEPTDPATFGFVCLLMVIVALLAGLIPAYRATRVDPIDALRYE